MGSRPITYLLSVLCFAVSLQIKATTFIPLPIEEQVDATDSVVLATNLGKAYKRLPNGEVVTEYSFKIDQSSGLPEHKVVSPNSFKVITPGGLWQGRYYQVHGVAAFKEGEQALLFLKESPHGWVVNNLAMGKYEVLEDARGTWFRNSVFPTHPKLGLISLNKMNDLLSHKFNSPLSVVNIDKYVHKDVIKKTEKNSSYASRRPASVTEEVENKDSSTPFGLVWMMLLFGILGFVYRLRAKKSR